MGPVGIKHVPGLHLWNGVVGNGPVSYAGGIVQGSCEVGANQTLQPLRITAGNRFFFDPLVELELFSRQDRWVAIAFPTGSFFAFSIGSPLQSLLSLI